MSYNSSSSYNYGGGSGGWDNNANEVSYGDSYAAYDNDDGNDPYNFKIKDPKKEKRKKEKKERRRKAKDLSTTARLSIEERTAKQLPIPKGYKILIALPEPEEQTKGGIIKASQTLQVEEVGSICGIILDMGDACYKGEKRYPNGPI